MRALSVASLSLLTVLITSAVLVFGYDIYYSALEDTDQHERGDR